MKKETQQNKEDKPSRAKKKKSRTSQSHMKFFSKKKKKNPTLTMKLWTNFAWDCLAVGQTDRKSNNKGLE